MTSINHYDRWLQIQELKARDLIEGEVWCLVSKSWYDQWKDACLGRATKKSLLGVRDASSLGPVDNTDVTDVNPQPGKAYDLMNMPPAIEGEHIELVPKDAHSLLQEWYGPTRYPYEFTVTPATPDDWKVHIELYPRRIRIYPITSETSALSPVYLITSRNSPASVLSDHLSSAAVLKAGMKLYRVDLDDEDPPYAWGEAHPMTLSDVSTLNSEKVPLFTLDPFEASWKEKSIDDASCALRETYVAIRPELLIIGERTRRADGRPLVPVGAKGLHNLGETCYMNSALQGISHTTELGKHFLDDSYLKELNPTNPLGSGGLVAAAYKAHLTGLFASSTTPAYASRDLKRSVARQSDQFSMYAQQDAQEFLAVLLDALHEDLNRVLKKPYVPNPEWEGGGDAEVLKLGEAFWEAYRMRNDSLVVDLLQGQFKSETVCSQCHHSSITFDPYMYLSAPIPVKRIWKNAVLFVPLDLTLEPTSIHIELPYESNISDIQSAVSKAFGRDSSQSFVAEVLQGTWYRSFSATDPVADIKPGTHLVIYELPIDLSPSTVVLPLYHVALDGGDQKESFIGIPTFVILDPSSSESASASLTLDSVHQAVELSSRRWGSLFFGAASVEVSDVTLRRGRSTGGFGSPVPISNIYGGSEPVEWTSRLMSSGGSSSGISLQPLDFLVANWKSVTSPRDDSTFWDQLSESTSKPSTTPAPPLPDSNRIPLSACLEALTAPETLNEWYCSTCKTHQPSAKRLFSIWTSPDILIIHLKRFSSSSSSSSEKITAFVEYPLEGLDLSEFVGRDVLRRTMTMGEAEKSAVYDLYAVSEHEGTVLANGHYRAYALNDHDGKWYHYADAKVKLARKEDVVNPHAYMLFYRRRKSTS